MKSPFFLLPFVVFGCGIVAEPLAAQAPPTGKVPAELEWVPPDCAGFIHVRFAALWDSAVGREVRKSIHALDPKILAGVEKELGLAPAQIDSVTVVFPELHDGAQPEVVIRVNTTERFERNNVLTAMGAEPLRDAEAKTSLPATMFRTRNRGILHLSGARAFTILTNGQGAPALLGKLLNRQPDGPLSAALRNAGGTDELVVAFDLAQVPALPFGDISPDLAPLRELRFALLSGRLAADRARFDVRLSFARPGLAVAGGQAVEAGRKLLFAQLADELEKLGKDEKENRFQIALLKELSKSLTDAKIQTNDAAVNIAAQVSVSQSLTKLLADSADTLRGASQRTQSQNNLKQLGLAMHNYEGIYGSLPPAAICDANGKPLLSWRVAVLPFLEQENLYKQFRLNEPWDSEHNQKLIAAMPKMYLLPGAAKKHELPSTHYQVIVGNNAMFELRRGTKFAQISDGLSNTLMVVEAENAVPWTKPDDIVYDPKQAPKFGFFFRNSSNALFGDGSVRAISKKTKVEILHLLIQRNDGQVIPELP